MSVCLQISSPPRRCGVDAGGHGELSRGGSRSRPAEAKRAGSCASVAAVLRFCIIQDYKNARYQQARDWELINEVSVNEKNIFSVCRFEKADVALPSNIANLLN